MAVSIKKKDLPPYYRIFFVAGYEIFCTFAPE